jgi:hypothetical protein
VKKPLTVLVGAGASLELGIPSTNQLTNAVTAALKGMRYPELPQPSVEAAITTLVEHAEEFYKPGFTFEHLQHVLEAISALRWTWTPGGGRVAEGLVTAGPASWAAPMFEGYFAALAQSTLYTSLRQQIAAASSAALVDARWPGLQRFWQRLKDEFEVSFVTLNYDTTIDDAIAAGLESQGFVPISGEQAHRFDPRVLARCPQLIHLHGSIRFGRREFRTDANRFAYEDGREDVYAYAETATATRNSGSGDVRTQAGRHCVVGPLITGLQKPDKLLGEPYSSYYSCFSRLVGTRDRLLVVGYGFGDAHVNAILRRFTRFHGPQRRVVSISKFDPYEMHGNWPARPLEHEIACVWSEQVEAFREMEYQNPWCSKNGLVRVYYEGLGDVCRSWTNELVDFLAS